MMKVTIITDQQTKDKILNTLYTLEDLNHYKSKRLSDLIKQVEAVKFCKNCKDKPINKNLIGNFCGKFCRSEYYNE
jgi:hypothetical protein